MGVILNHNANPLKHLKFLGKPKNGLYLGVELEVECGSSSVKPSNPFSWNQDIQSAYYKKLREWQKINFPEIFATPIQKKFHKELICKSDGTIVNGFEIVTAPMGLTQHQSFWPKLITPVTLDAEGNNNPRLFTGLHADANCGMHVHMSKFPFGNYQIWLMHCFLCDNKNSKFVRAVAGRTSNMWSTKYDKDYVEGQPLKVIEKYEALNLKNPDTLEVRIFASTTNAEELLTRVEFVDALGQWVLAKTKLKREQLTPTTLYNWTKQFKRYARVNNFLERYLCQQIQ